MGAANLASIGLPHSICAVRENIWDTEERDEYPKVTQADLERATFRVALKPTPRKRRATMLLDTGLVETFKGKAGERGYQTLINETLRQAMERDDLEERLRRILREELGRALRRPAPDTRRQPAVERAQVA